MTPTEPSNLASGDVLYIRWMPSTPRLFRPWGIFTLTSSPTANWSILPHLRAQPWGGFAHLSVSTASQYTPAGT